MTWRYNCSSQATHVHSSFALFTDCSCCLHHLKVSNTEVLCRRWAKLRHLYYPRLGGNPVTLHVICLVIIMQIKALLLWDICLPPPSVIQNPTLGANCGSVRREIKVHVLRTHIQTQAVILTLLILFSSKHPISTETVHLQLVICFLVMFCFSSIHYVHA